MSLYNMEIIEMLESELRVKITIKDQHSILLEIASAKRELAHDKAVWFTPLCIQRTTSYKVKLMQLEK